MTYEKGSKDQEDFALNLTKTNEALMNDMGEDTHESPPEAKSVKKATEASTCANEAVSPMINHVSNYTPTFFWRKISNHGIRLRRGRSTVNLDRPVWR